MLTMKPAQQQALNPQQAYEKAIHHMFNGDI
jgi:hypothetical protein